ncbi:hypothetical protein MesoLjLc_56570 [Mesorhizobium sp. L-8-10]|uniref:hypothetical protein n=1 Tax=Mesorhizobium sp. L-8-10 TaxID=2744523 RepID=UPI001928D224|nr:hypothetical protein [Mesorhizobium sp. L-8-10]BCH33727.1 hypothetical protein MesoLjLc_56570 [Mesorhizobium sp. L-8-10]
MDHVQSGMIMGAAVLTLATIIIVTVIIQLSATWRARAQLAREDEYKKLAEQATAASTSAAAAGHRLADDISEIKTRIASIEKLLREVA